MTSSTPDRFAKPAEIDPITRAFPANVVGTLLPPWDEIPEEFRRNWLTDPWCKQASTWFFDGVDRTRSTIEPREGIDAEAALRHLGTCLRSWEPKHEHKIAGVGWLMSRWFGRLELVRRGGAK